MAQTYGEGIIRTESGRQTYAADGLGTSPNAFQSYRPLVEDSARDNRRSPLQRIDERGSSFSGSTKGPSEKSSHASLGRANNEGRQDSEQTDLGNTTSHGDPNQRKRMPAGMTAGAGEENFDPDADVEKQSLRNQRGLDKEDDEKDPNLVTWDGDDDPGNPQNFKPWKKWLITCTTGIMTFTVTFASSVFSTATQVTALEFGVSSEVMVLGTSLFVLGFAFGPMYVFSSLHDRLRVVN